MTLMQEALGRQNAILQASQESQAAMNDRIEEDRERATASQMRDQVTRETQSTVAWRESDRAELKRLPEKLDRFKTIRQEGRITATTRFEVDGTGAQSASGSAGSATAMHGSSLSRPTSPLEDGTPKAAADAGPEMDGYFIKLPQPTLGVDKASPEKILEEETAIQAAIRKMERRAEQPQTLIKSQLQEYQAVDQTFGNEQFPPVYRTSIAGPFLSEVYSAGETGEVFARKFIEARQAKDAKSLKPLVPTMIAIDTILMIDREPGMLNKVSVEKLARRPMP